MRAGTLFVALMMLLQTKSVASDGRILATLKGTLTSNTRFLYNINRYDPFDPGKNITSNLGYGADIRWNILWDRFSIGLSYERIEAKEVTDVYDPRYFGIRIPYEEGFQISILEISGYYVVPISTDKIHFYLGGGIGLHDGERLYSIAGARAATLDSKPSMGIHVLTGVEYQVLSYFLLRGELKFRDPHFDVTNTFEQSTVEYQNRRILLPQTITQTRVNLYGVNYVIGIVFAL